MQSSIKENCHYLHFFFGHSYYSFYFVIINVNKYVALVRRGREKWLLHEGELRARCRTVFSPDLTGNFTLTL